MSSRRLLAFLFAIDTAKAVLWSTILLGQLYGGVGNTAVYLSWRFILFDVATGIVKAARWGHLSSQVAQLGIRKKLAYLLLPALGHAIDLLLGTNDAAKSALAYVVISIEGISILENLKGMGLMLPLAVERSLQVLFRSREDVVGPLDVLTHAPSASSDSKGSK